VGLDTATLSTHDLAVRKWCHWVYVALRLSENYSAAAKWCAPEHVPMNDPSRLLAHGADDWLSGKMILLKYYKYSTWCHSNLLYNFRRPDFWIFKSVMLLDPGMSSLEFV